MIRTDYGEDVLRIWNIATKAGYIMDTREVVDVWERISGERCASWLIVSKDDKEVLEMLEDHFRYND